MKVHGGGALWCRGGADSRLDKVGALISPDDGFAEEGGSNRSVCGGVR
jgi:hypothetical protein